MLDKLKWHNCIHAVKLNRIGLEVVGMAKLFFSFIIFSRNYGKKKVLPHPLLNHAPRRMQWLFSWWAEEDGRMVQDVGHLLRAQSRVRALRGALAGLTQLF